MLSRVIVWSIRHRVAVHAGLGRDRRRRRAGVSAPAHRRLPRHDAGAGPGQHRGARAVAARDRAADHRAGRARHRRARGPRRRALDLPVRLLAGDRHLRGRHRPLPRAPGGGRAAAWRSSCRSGSSGRRSVRSPPAWARSSTTWCAAPATRWPSCAPRRTGSCGRSSPRCPGVAEVNAWGGDERQVHVVVDPAALKARGLTLAQLAEAIAGENANQSGGTLDEAGESSLIQGVGLVTEPERGRGDRRRRARTACRSGSATWRAWSRGARSGAARSPPTARARWCSGSGFLLVGENSHDVAGPPRARAWPRSPRPCRRDRRRAGLPAHHARRSRARHRAREPVRGRRSWSSRCCSCSSAACGPGSSWRPRSRSRSCSPSTS